MQHASLAEEVSVQVQQFAVFLPADTTRPTRTRRKRKPATANSSTPNTGMNSTSSKKKSPSTPGFAIATQDVMVVGEPSLMGGEFGDEDERLITRCVKMASIIL